ncbi:hypothetical protein PCL_06728 [Purpureocillium lilacinum]|uniref:Uncharacterized protein n=1 Tax=Purpureocillium lilacinum TaxID=33203 RepID=A0A2U3DU23_PURLI|nr:hypothetical protein Purlil1_314 [Purpureocillium lilacinum]PWI65757.1 hypothetical protein PCL_06728 [Purpureocillium lilacinum]
MRRAGLGTLDPGSQTGWLVGGLEPEVSVRQWGRAALPGTSGVRTRDWGWMDGFWFCGWLAGWLVVVRDLGLGLAPTLVAQLFAPGSARDAPGWAGADAVLRRRDGIGAAPQ